MSGPIILPFVTTYDDKGARKADLSLKGLMKTQLAGAVSVGLLVKELGKAVNAYAEDQKAQDLLKVAVQNSTGATDAQVMALEGSIAKMEMSAAVSDELLRPAMANLVRSTKSVAEAQDLMGIALDISAAKGLDVVTVSNALSKASLGQYTALKKLGIGLDENAVKAGDFNTIATDLKYTFEGASQAAADSAAGGFKKLNIAVDNLYETVGSKLGPTLGNYATVLSMVVTKTLNAEKSTDGWVKTLGHAIKDNAQIGMFIRAMETMNGAMDRLANGTKTAGAGVVRHARQIHAFERAMMSSYTNGLKPTKEELKRLAGAHADADKAAERQAKTLKDKLTTRLKAAADAVKVLEDNFNAMRDSYQESITGMVSLSDAVRTQDEAESNLSDALKERRDAYTALAKLDPTADANAYADALNRVAEAEANVGSATSARANADYSKVFAKQIADAQQFANNLSYLVNSAGLQQAGLAQLINLGPVAGLAVTKDLINGTSGLTVGGLNQSMSDLSQAGLGLGLASAGSFLGTSGNVNGAQQISNYNINVSGGLISTPSQIGREIIDAILASQKTSGQVFVSIGSGVGTL